MADNLIIAYGYKNTGKSTLLKQRITEYMRLEFTSLKTKGRLVTYELSAIEVQSGEKVVCLLSGKQKEVAEDKNGYFSVQLEDFFQISTTTTNTANAASSA